MESLETCKELAALFSDSKEEIIELWQEQLNTSAGTIITAVGEESIRGRSREILDLTLRALPTGIDLSAPPYSPLGKVLRELSREFTTLNFTPSETATYIFSMKDALLATCQGKYPNRERLNEIIMKVNKLVDKIGLLTFEAYTNEREVLIREQHRSIRESAVPVIKVWERTLMVPLIGILDSERTQLIMEKVLDTIEKSDTKVVILDITGIPTIDTLVARHLLSTATAVKLMGASCIVTGISSHIAQTVVQMGVGLEGLQTKSTMAAGLKEGFRLLSLTVSVDGENG